MTGNRSLLYNERDITPTSVTVGNGERLSASICGTVDLLGHLGTKLPLDNVLFVPGLKDALFSVGHFLDNGSQAIQFTRNSCQIYDTIRKEPLLTGTRHHQHYEIPIMPFHVANVTTTSLIVWHNRSVTLRREPSRRCHPAAQ